MGNVIPCRSEEVTLGAIIEEAQNNKISKSSSTKVDLTDSLRSDDDFLYSSSVRSLHHNPLPILNESEAFSAQPGDAPSATSYLLQSPVNDELGAIQYKFRVLADAQEESRKSGLPILCIEAELPGDVEAGLEVLSHPLLVEAAESLFITVAPAVEEKTNASRYRPSHKHKAWFTTVRFLDEHGQDLVEGIGGDLLCTMLLSVSMVKALQLKNRTIPAYLELLREEETGKQQLLPSGMMRRCDRQGIFGVASLPAAELEFAGLDGVLATRGGKWDDQQLIQVTYDSKRLSYGTLLRFALDRQVADIIYFQSQDESVAAQIEAAHLLQKPQCVKLDQTEEKIVPDNSSSKSDLRRTEMRFVPMTELQATKVNRLIHEGLFNKATHLLSPRQGMILMKSYSKVSERRLDAIDVPIGKAWKIISEQKTH
jgi:hypothetical protein